MGSVFGDLVNRADFVTSIAPQLWQNLLGNVDEIRETQRDHGDKLDRIIGLLTQQHGHEIAQMHRQIEDVTTRHEGDRDATANLLSLLLEREVSLDQWSTELGKAEDEVRKLLDTQYRLPNEASEAERDLVEQARSALERFDFPTAEALRRSVRELGRQRRCDAQELMAAQDAAETAEIAATVAAGLDYQRAADLYREAAETPYLSQVDQLNYHLKVGQVLERLGEEYGDNNALEYAILHLQNVVLPLAVDDRNRAKSLLILANLTYSLGVRRQFTETLEIAKQTYERSAELWARLRMPEEVANAMTGVGIALQALGEREDDTKRLEEAVTIYREALKELTRSRRPWQWAMIWNNMGNALRSHGERENGTARLEEAVDAYREALKEWNRDRMPLDWAMAQNNLGGVLTTLGECVSSTRHLEQAATAFHEALKEWTRDRVPVYWAGTQANLSGVETVLFEKTGDTVHLSRAEVYLRAALEVYEEGGITHYAEIAREQLDEIAALRAGAEA